MFTVSVCDQCQIVLSETKTCGRKFLELCGFQLGSGLCREEDTYMLP